MSRVKGKDTSPEIKIRKALFKKGLRYRLHVKDMPGKPDLVFPKYKTVLFINGCFWHLHSCPAGKLPEANKEFWQKKIEGNAARDRDNIKKLLNSGLNVLIIWECSLKGREKIPFPDLIDRIICAIKAQNPFTEIPK